MLSRTGFFVPFALLASAALAAPPELLPSEVRLPLAEVLRLHAVEAAADVRAVPPPPVTATLDRLEFTARVGAAVAQLAAEVEATVLTSGQWVVVPLVQIDGNLQVVDIPKVEGGAVTVVDGHLSLVTNVAGRHRFTLSFTAKAKRSGERRSVAFSVGRATVATLHVLHDAADWRVVGAGAEPEAVLLPENATFSFAWDRPAEAVSRAVAPVVAPDIESVVTKAVASTVTTLDGARITRLLCELRFQGAKEIRFTVPEGQVADKAYVNRQLVPLVQGGNDVALAVRPQEVGGTTGTVELVLTSTDPPYPLSGTLAFVLPRSAWVIHELDWSLHLPEVFNYRWTGGSLQPAADVPAAFSYAIPVTGKALSFQQFLIAGSAPRVNVDHDIDLAGHYHCPVAVARR